MDTIAEKPAPRIVASADKPMPVIRLRGVTKAYVNANGDETRILNGLSFDIAPGSFNVIRGESGSGKTSLLRILGLLDLAFEGEYRFAGAATSEMADWYIDEVRTANIGFVFQEGLLFGHLNVHDNIAVPGRIQQPTPTGAVSGATVEQRIGELAPTFFSAREIEDDVLGNIPSRVSGGQRQRAAIMRSVLTAPAVILADEPTASLDERRKGEVVEALHGLCALGHTVVVVSHDSVFYDRGRQLLIQHGRIEELDAGAAAGRVAPIPPRLPAAESSAARGWRPRASAGFLLGQALRETFLRPIFLALVVISLCVGVAQMSIFSSVMIGSQAFIDDAISRGSRLNRLEVKPRSVDLAARERFPVVEELKANAGISAIVPRRATLLRVVTPSGQRIVHSAMGLHGGDPEYRLLSFVAGGAFSGDDRLEVIITNGLANDLWGDASSGRIEDIAGAIGRTVTVEIPQFSKTGEELAARLRRVALKVVGIVLHGEGGRQAYLPNTTQLVFDRYKMDRLATFDMPTDSGEPVWTATPDALARIADFPWQDQLHVYTTEVRDIIPVFKFLSGMGYKPTSDVWNYKWVLDIRSILWRVFFPLLGMITLAVILTVATNLVSSAKLREKEFALWRILGMRRGDLLTTQVLSTVIMVAIGTAVGLGLALTIIEVAKRFLAEQDSVAGLNAVFAPVGDFYAFIVAGALVVSVAAAVYPAARTAKSDPAKVLQS